MKSLRERLAKPVTAALVLALAAGGSLGITSPASAVPGDPPISTACGAGYGQAFSDSSLTPVLIRDDDPDYGLGQSPVAYSLQSQPLRGAASTASSNASGIELRYTPNKGFAGIDRLVYKLTGSKGTVQYCAFTIGVRKPGGGLPLIELFPAANKAAVGQAFNFEVAYSDWAENGVPIDSLSTWKLDFKDGTAATGNRFSGPFVGHTFAKAGRYDVTLTATTESGKTLSVVRPVDISGTATPAPVTAKRWNFASEPWGNTDGATAERGTAYSDARGFGFVDANNGAPKSFVGNTRHRNGYDFTHLDLKPNSPGVSGPAEWRVKVANGTYTLIYGMGDPDFADSKHGISYEGKNGALLTPTKSAMTRIYSDTVTVSDGMLNIRQAAGAFNTKLSFVDLRPQSTTPTTPPPAEPGNRQISTTYFGPSDQPGNKIMATYNNHGEAYSVNAAGFGSGWQTLSGQPLDLTANDRSRTTATGKFEYIHMDLQPNTTGTKVQGRYVESVTNRLYRVHITVGDPAYTDSVHLIRVNGKQIGTFTPTDKERTKVLVGDVNVTDGKLIIDQVGGKNTKISSMQLFG